MLIYIGIFMKTNIFLKHSLKCKTGFNVIATKKIRKAGYMSPGMCVQGVTRICLGKFFGFIIFFVFIGFIGFIGSFWRKEK